MKTLFRLAAAGIVVAAAIVPVSGCASCDAIGYVYAGPAVIEVAAPLLADLSMSACFGAGCEPALLARADGQRWEVPQEPPFVGDTFVGDGSERLLRIVVTDPSGTALVDSEHEIPVKTEPTGVFGQCPGPFTFEPVPISLLS